MASNMAMRGCSLSHILRFAGSLGRSSGNTSASIEAISYLDFARNRRKTFLISILLMTRTGIKRDDASRRNDLRIGPAPELLRVFSRRAFPRSEERRVGKECR